jgi:hypothetical protein
VYVHGGAKAARSCPAIEVGILKTTSTALALVWRLKAVTF